MSRPARDPTVARVPFGQDCPWKEALGISEGATNIVAALVAAEFTQLGPVTARELEELTEFSATKCLLALERAGFVEVVGRAEGHNTKLYSATPKAWRALGLVGWSLLKEVA